VVRLLLLLSPEGLLRGFQASGHAGEDPAGRNLPCAALTTLLRTAARVCAARGLAQGGGRGDPGELSLSLGSVAAEHEQWLRGVTEYLVRGASDLHREYPGEIVLRVETVEV
jgi:uncharacterized protein YsxB (DUF464 family)